jgi:hypothetical protein
MKRICLSAGRTIAVVLFCSPTASAAALLAEITWTNPTPLALPETWHFLALNYSEGIDPPGEIWTTELPRDGQFGERLIADAATVARLNSKLTTRPSSGEAIYAFFENGAQRPCGNFCQAYAGFPFDYLLGGVGFRWSNGPLNQLGFTGAAYVPQLGRPNEALTGYRLTGLERVITPTSQTVYFYGNAVVPEPASWVLAGVGLIALLSRKR